MLLTKVINLNLHSEDKIDLVDRLNILSSEFLSNDVDYQASDFNLTLKEIPTKNLTKLLNLETKLISIFKDHPKIRYTEEWKKFSACFFEIKEEEKESFNKKERVRLELEKLFKINPYVKKYFSKSDFYSVINEDLENFSNSEISNLDFESYFYKVIYQVFIKSNYPDFFNEKTKSFDSSLLKEKNEFIYSLLTNYFLYNYCLKNFYVSGLNYSNGYEGILKAEHPLSKKFSVPDKSYLYACFTINNDFNQEKAKPGDKFIYPKGKNGLIYKAITEQNFYSYWFDLKINPAGLKVRHKLNINFIILNAED